MLLFWPVFKGSLLLVYHILMLWRWKASRSSHFWHTSPWPSLRGLTLYPQHPSSGCSLISHTAPNMKWREPSHPQHEQAMSVFIALNKCVCLSLALFIVCLKNSHKNRGFYVSTPWSFLSMHRGKFRGTPLRKHASAQIMGFRCEGLGSCNLAANNYRHLHSLHREVAVLHAENSSAWNKLKWEKIYLRNLRQQFERLIRVLWFLTEVCFRFLDQQPISC